MGRKIRFVNLAATFFCLVLTVGCFLMAGGEGVVLETLVPGLGLEKTGLRPGDLLQGWFGANAGPDDEREGSFDTVWDWEWFEVEIAPRGPLALEIVRNGVNRRLDLDLETVDGLRVRPILDADLLAGYSKGLDRIESGDALGGIAIWQDLNVVGDSRVWLTLRSAEAFGDVADFEKESEFLALAQNQASSPRASVCVLMARCHKLWRRQRFDVAEMVARQWYEVSKVNPESLVFARCLNLLGNIAWGRGDLDTAEKHHKHCKEIRLALAPGSLALADSFNNLGLVAADRGKLQEAEEDHRQALEIRQGKLPGSIKEATSWLNLGLVKTQLGDLEKGESFLLKAVDLIEKVSPQHELLADAFTNLGVLAWQKSQLDRAELYFSRALENLGAVPKTGAKYATTLHNLGILIYARGDIEKAKTIFLEALDIYEKEAPNSIWHADVLNNLGAIASKRERWDEARDFFKKVVAINEALAPGSLSLGDALTNLGSVYEIMGQGMQGEACYLRALEIYERMAPESIMHGNTLTNLAILTSKRGELGKALRLSGQAYALIKNLAASEQTGNQFSILETGYRTHITLLVKADRKEEAFHISEEFRALSMLRQLGQRAVLHNLFPDAQKALKEIGSRCDTLQQQWWETSDPQKRAQQHKELLSLRVKAGDIRREILSQSPHLVEYGKPLEVGGASKSLSSGSLLISFLVQYEGTLVFALSPEEGLIVRSLPVTKAALEEKIELFYAVNAEPANSIIREVHQELGQQLFQILLAPIRESLARAERLVLIPDGPLWYLPFGALGEMGEGGYRYLIEWKPMTTVASATLYDYLKRRPLHDRGRIAAFGAPSYTDGGPRIASTDDLSRSPARQSLRPLPGTGKEVAMIASLFPQTDTFLGPNASEANFKALGADYAWVHVGSHAVYEENPSHFKTGVYFSIPATFVEGKDNGILQFREIFDLNLETDLLVLSACQTALGKDVGGQGLLGFSRAFQGAGVRNIVASLWEVDDEATAQLMANFYRYLHEGNAPAQALRYAQIDMIHNKQEKGWWAKVKALFGVEEKDYSSHLYWAPFQFIGPY